MMRQYRAPAETVVVPIVLAGNSLSADAPARTAVKASLAVATLGIVARPRTLACATTGALILGARINVAPASANLSTPSTSRTISAPTAARLAKRRLNCARLASASGELSGFNQREAGFYQHVADLDRVTRFNTAQDGDEWNCSEGRIEIHAHRRVIPAPPSIASTVPVIHSDASEDRNRIASATSSAVPSRPSG